MYTFLLFRDDSKYITHNTANMDIYFVHDNLYMYFFVRHDCFSFINVAHRFIRPYQSALEQTLNDLCSV